MKTITDGGTVRKLWLADRGAFRDHLLRLDPISRHQRFAMGASDDFLRAYAETGFSIACVIHGWFEGARLCGVGELRLIGQKGDEAEAAFSVEAEWQARGVGSLLMERTLLAARNRGIRRIWMNCLASNRHMQRLARRFGAELEFESGDVVGLVLPDGPTPGSYFREAVADAVGWTTAIFDLQRRLVAPTRA